MNTSHLAVTIFPYHQEMYGLRWRGGKVRCVPMEVVGHKVPKTKGDRGLSSTESIFISLTLGTFHSVESCKPRFPLFIYLADLLKVKLKDKFREVHFHRHSQ